MTRVAMFENGELETRKYRGMNPNFVKRVWAKRRANPLIAIDNSQRVAKLAAAIDNGGVRAILAKVALKHGLTIEDLTGANKAKPYVRARNEAVQTVARERPDMTNGQLGKLFGDRNPSTISFMLGKKAGRKPS